MQTQTDDQLEHHVQNAFSQFGTCYVKIRRDSNGMPFAFVQYEVNHHPWRRIKSADDFRLWRMLSAQSYKVEECISIIVHAGQKSQK